MGLYVCVVSASTQRVSGMSECWGGGTLGGSSDGLRVDRYERNERATISEGMPMILSINPLAIPKSMSPIFSLFPVSQESKDTEGWAAGLLAQCD